VSDLSHVYGMIGCHYVAFTSQQGDSRALSLLFTRCFRLSLQQPVGNLSVAALSLPPRP
jgi:hypothetical protein